MLVGFLGPLTNAHTTQALADAGATAFAMEAIPRISRAQSMDALSSQSNVAGYKSVLLATQHLGRFLPMMMTAAGTIPPAHVLVLGAGVAGLQAIATARRLGAQVTGYDVRAAVAEQVQSLGAAFLELEAGKGAEGEGGYARELTDEEKAAQQAELADKIATFDVVITTALVPGRRAPILVTKHSVENMKAGSVIVDLAGESGGNCELTEPGEVVVKHDVTIVSPLNLPASMPEHASALYARNVQSLLELLVDEEGALNLELRRRDRRRRLHHARRRDRPRGRRRPQPPAVEAADRRRTPASTWSCHGPHRDRDPRARRVRRLPGHLEGAEHAAHAAHVGHERDPRHRRARRPHRDRPRRRLLHAARSSSSRSSSARSTSSAASS